MAETSTTIISPPYKEKISDNGGFFTPKWSNFIKIISDYIEPMGAEQSFQIVNNTAVATSIDKFSFNYKKTSHVSVDYVIQRVTTGGGATELIESGIFLLVYKPTSLTWSKVTIGTAGPSASGVTLTVNSSGQVQYVSTNITGTAQISKIAWRAKTMSVKNSLYSEVGK